MTDSIIYINDKKIEVRDWDFTVLQLCEQLDISIPRFCYHRELSIAGNCRMCMIEIKNSVKPVIACATSLSKNMYIYTNTELVKIARENVLEFLSINHPLDCPICDQGGECDLQDQTMIYGSDRGRFKEVKRSVEDKYFGPIVKTIMTRCIHCTRCIRYSEEIAGISILGTMGRGKETEISTYVSKYLHSELIGNIVDICPVGALTLKPYAFRARPWELQTIVALDIFDSLGSTIQIQIKGQELMRVLPVRNDLLNREWITDKVRFFYEGALLNRLLFSMVNIYNYLNKKQLIHCSLEVAYMLYINEYKKAIKKKKSMISLCGEEYHLMEIYLMKHYMSQLGINLYNGDKEKKEFNIDIRNEWLLNKDLNEFINIENLMFININMKYENAIMNSLLLKNINEIENKKINYIGIYFKNIYEVIHIGLSINKLKYIQKGQDEFCYNIKKEKIHWVESDEQPLSKYSLKDYINLFELKKNENYFSYIASNCTELNKFESGIELNSNIENIEEIEVGFLHILGNFKKEKIVLPKSDFVIYQSHHLPEIEIEKYDLFLPVINFYEVGVRLSEMIWLNNQLVATFFFDPVITAAGDSKSNEYYWMLLLKLIKYELKNLEITEWDIEKWVNLLEINNVYKDVYEVNLNNIKTKIFFNQVHENILNRINPISYYKNNIYSRNSVTLNTVYLNELNILNENLKM